MPINSFLYPGPTNSNPYEVDNSCRFDEGRTTSLSRTLGTPTTANVWTFSCWVKKSKLGDYQNLLAADGGSGLRDCIRFQNDDKLTVFFNEVSGGEVKTNRVFKDPSAWYNIVVAVDTTQGTASNRVKIYVNGTQETSLATTSYPSEDHTCFMNTNDEHRIGRDFLYSEYFDGYLAEVCFIDGQQLTPSSFGEFDSDSPRIWRPKDVSGLTFGNNGVYLDFEDSSNLGNDKNGGTDWAENNIAATDQATDTPTNNFATFNPLDGTSTGTAFVLSEGNCKGVTAVDTNGALQSTMAVSSGKWYAEFKIAKVGDNLSGGRTTVGIGSRNNAQVSGNYYGNTASPIDSYGKYSASAHYYSNNGSTTSYGSSFVDDDIIGVYLDLDNNKLYFSENGSLYSSTGIDITAAASTLNGHYHIGASDASANDNGEYLANYGGCPAFTISSAVSDDNGYGSFEYSPNITGDSEAKKFYALCTKNLAEFG